MQSLKPERFGYEKIRQGTELKILLLRLLQAIHGMALVAINDRGLPAAKYTDTRFETARASQ